MKIEHDITALDLICKLHAGMSKQKAKKIIKTSTFRCNGKAMKTIPTTVFHAGENVEIVRNTITDFKNKHPDRNHPVIIKYEDEWLVVAIKPVGLLSCKSKTQRGKSFDKMLEEYISKRDNKKTTLWIAHRIDREVEGLLIFAKSEEVQQKIKDDWKSVTKKYLALTESCPSPKKGIIESWLKEGKNHKMMVHPKEVQDSKFAKTEYQVVKSFKNYHLVEITLHTGRKNQIRAHLGSLKCPIVGDYTYGANKDVVRQVRLVAYWLKFKHPVNSKQIQLEYQPKAKFFKPQQEKDENYKNL